MSPKQHLTTAFDNYLQIMIETCGVETDAVGCAAESTVETLLSHAHCLSLHPNLTRR